MQSPNLISCSDLVCLHSAGVEKPLYELRPHVGAIHCCLWTPNAKYIITGGKDGKIVLTPTNPRHGDLMTLEDDYKKGYSVDCIDASETYPDYLASGGSDSIVRLWDLKARPKLVQQWQMKSGVNGVSWNLNSTALACGNSVGDISIFSTTNKTSLINSFRHRDYEGIKALKFNPTADHTLLSVGNAGSLYFWDVNKPTQEHVISQINSHTKACTSLAFNPKNSNLFCTVSYDSKLIFFDLREKKEVRKVTLTGHLTSVSFQSNANNLCIANSEGQISYVDIKKIASSQFPLLTGHGKSAINCLHMIQSPAIEELFSKDFHPGSFLPAGIKRDNFIEKPSISSMATQRQQSHHEGSKDISPVVSQRSVIVPPESRTPTQGLDSLNKAGTKLGLEVGPTKHKFVEMREDEFEQIEAYPKNSQKGNRHVQELELAVKDKQFEILVNSLVDKKMEKLKEELIESIRDDQRNIHVEMIRQFEMQIDMIVNLLQEKDRDNLHLISQNRELRQEIELLKKTSY
jgi:WD40 repeat protein